MDLGGLLERALAGLGSQIDGARFVSLVFEPPRAVSAEGMIASRALDNIFHWNPPASGELAGMSFTAGNHADTILGRKLGPPLRHSIQRDNRVAEWRAPGTEWAPDARWVCGGAFDPTYDPPYDDPVWSGFRALHLDLPEWTLVAQRTKALRWTFKTGWIDDRARLLELAHRAFVTFSMRPAPWDSEALSVENVTRGAWRAAVGGALETIGSGAIDKIVLARRARVVLAQRPARNLAQRAERPEILASLRASSPENVVFGVKAGSGMFVGASPERLVTRRGHRAVSDALAGTTTHDGDALLASSKDRHEHAIVVESLRETYTSLGAHVHAPDAPVVVKRGTLRHLWTPVTAVFDEAPHVLDLVAKLHPTPAVCGRPREIARQRIAELEPHPRGWYAGYVGWFDERGDGEFVVGLRSAVLRGSEAWVYAGAGIVAGSDPDAEYDETAAKQAAMLHALGVRT